MDETKRKPGRPRLDNAKRVMVAVRMTAEEYESLRRRAAATGETVASVIRDLIYEAQAQ